MTELSENDVNFLWWIHNRLQHVFKVPHNMDYMIRLRKILRKLGCKEEV